MEHWRGREIKVVADPEQPVQADGEVLKPGPLTARILAGAARFLVPKAAADAAGKSE
jgi:diacylglycerol kinase family enzyme